MSKEGEDRTAKNVQIGYPQDNGQGYKSPRVTQSGSQNDDAQELKGKCFSPLAPAVPRA